MQADVQSVCGSACLYRWGRVGATAGMLREMLKS
jgi:hypothetical protein